MLTSVFCHLWLFSSGISCDHLVHQLIERYGTICRKKIAVKTLEMALRVISVFAKRLAPMSDPQRHVCFFNI